MKNLDNLIGLLVWNLLSILLLDFMGWLNFPVICAVLTTITIITGLLMKE